MKKTGLEFINEYYNKFYYYTDEELRCIENIIYENKSEKQKIILELNRIINLLDKNYLESVTYAEKIKELKQLISILNYDKNIIEEIKVKIVMLEAALNMKIYLISCILEAKKGMLEEVGEGNYRYKTNLNIDYKLDENNENIKLK